MKKFWIVMLFVVLSSFSVLFAEDPAPISSAEELSYSLPEFRVITAKEGEILEPPNPPWRLIGSIITFGYKNSTNESSCMVLGCESVVSDMTTVTIYYFTAMSFNGKEIRSIQFEKQCDGKGRWILICEPTITPKDLVEVSVQSITTW